MSGVRFSVAAALLAVLLSSPSLQLGYVLDDKIHQAMLRPELGFPEAVDPVWGLFAFMDGNPARNRAFMELGIFPWWTEPRLRAQFLRPVTALTHLFDHEVAPGRPVFAHAHSLLWLAVCVILAGLLYRSAFGGAAAGLATLLFAVDDAHGIPVAWLANRNALIALALGLAAIVLHDRGQRLDARWARVCGPLCLLAGLLSAEAAVGAVAYLFAYAVFLPTPVWRLDRRGWWARGLTLVPHAVAAIAWKALHSAGGFGAWGSGLYIDPGREPLAYVSAALVRIPILLLAQWTPIPAEVAMVLSPPMRAGLAAVGVGVVVALMLWAWRRSAGAPAVGWFLLGSVLAAVPVAAVFPSNRVLVFVGVGVFGAIGYAVAVGDPRVGGRWLVVALLIVHLPLAAVGTVLTPPAVHYLGNGLPGRCSAAVAPDEALDDTTLVFINAHALCAAYVLPSRALDGWTRPAHVRVLGSLFSDMEVSRTGPRALTVRVPDGYHHHPMDRLMRRGDVPMPVGRVVRLSGFEARIEGHNAEGRVDRVRFVFDRPFDDRRLRLFILGAEGAAPFTPPAEGDTVYVPAVL